MGLAVLLQSLQYCLIFFLCFEVMGRAVFSPQALLSNDMWNQVAIIFCTQIAIFGFMACLTKFTTNWGHIIFIAWIGMMILIAFPFFSKIGLDSYTNFILSFSCLIVGALLSGIASRLWYLAELN